MSTKLKFYHLLGPMGNAEVALGMLLKWRILGF
jgi:hypothetical protein